MILEKAFRLLRVKKGKPHTLFHGFHGTRELPQDKILRAVERHVWNPGKKGKSEGFLSGWHVLLSEDECREYLKRFKDHSDLVVCLVWVTGIRDKPRSKVKLASHMRIDSLNWARALKEGGHDR